MGLFNQKVVLLDGAVGSNLMKAGMPQGVCVEQWLLEHPENFSLQANYARAGANIVYAPTFGANRAKLAQFGLQDKVEPINSRIVELTRKVVGNGVLVAGNVSPTGLFIEPFGEQSFPVLIDVYEEQMKALKAAGADLIAAETLMNMADARACLLAAKRCGLEILVTITVDENGRTLSGMPLLPCLVTLQAMGAAAVGLNCSAGPEQMAKQLAPVAKYAKVPLVAKPNAGSPGQELSASEFTQQVKGLVQAGATVLGGCCGTTPEHIMELRKWIDQAPALPDIEPEDVLIAANATSAMFLQEKTIALSEPIPCSTDLADDLIDAEDGEGNVALVEVKSPQDAYELAMQVHMSPLPVAIRAADAESLETALLLYQGRAIVDSKSDVEEKTLQHLADWYGAIVY